MADEYSTTRGTTSALFRVGVGGAQLKNLASPAGTRFEVRNSADGATGSLLAQLIAWPSTVGSEPASPQDGSLYFDTGLGELMAYDTTRAKWLSVTRGTIRAGRSGNTNPANYYRAIDSMVLDNANLGVPVPKGTLVSLAWSRSDTDLAQLEVLVNGSVITELASSAAGSTRTDTLNIDFAAGLMSFRNKAGGNQTSNVQIVAIYKLRA